MADITAGYVLPYHNAARGTNNDDTIRILEDQQEIFGYGYEGDDTFIIDDNDSSSFLRGGEGNDTLILPGVKAAYSVRFANIDGEGVIDLFHRKTGHTVRLYADMENIQFRHEKQPSPLVDVLPELQLRENRDRVAVMNGG